MGSGSEAGEHDGLELQRGGRGVVQRHRGRPGVQRNVEARVVAHLWVRMERRAADLRSLCRRQDEAQRQAGQQLPFNDRHSSNLTSLLELFGSMLRASAGDQRPGSKSELGSGGKRRAEGSRVRFRKDQYMDNLDSDKLNQLVGKMLG